MLNVLAGEAKGGNVTGSVLINGKELKNNREMKEISGFVFQDDVILETMTVREALFMSAKLRLPQSLSDSDKMKRVNELLALLRLTKAADTIIGSTTVRGISGGERKRTALAMELVTNPSILFLDEPTSGLDSFTAYNVVEILKNLAQSGRTIVVTIHQPSSDVFHLFDDLCLLAEGRVMYFGPVNSVVPYFSQLGYECPQYTNPSDYFFMSILNTERSLQGGNDQFEPKAVEKQIEKDKLRVSTLLDAWDGSKEADNMEAATKKAFGTHGFTFSSLKFKSIFPIQFRYLLGRALRNALRNRFIVRMKFFQAIFIAMLIGLIYFDIQSKSFEQQVQNRAGAIFFICVNILMSATIGVLSIFSSEKQVFIREFGAGYYSLAAYFFSKTLVELPFQIIFPFIQTVLMYWMVGFSTTQSYSFVVFAIIIMILSNSGTALGIFFASVFSDLTTALAVTPVALIPLMIFGGLFVNNDSIPIYFDWIKYLSPIKYGFEALIKNEYDGWSYNRTQTTATPSGPVVVSVKVTGDDMIKQLGLNNGLSVASLAFILLAMYIGLLSFAYCALWNTTRRK